MREESFQISQEKAEGHPGRHHYEQNSHSDCNEGLGWGKDNAMSLSMILSFNINCFRMLALFYYV